MEHNFESYVSLICIDLIKYVITIVKCNIYISVEMCLKKKNKKRNAFCKQTADLKKSLQTSKNVTQVWKLSLYLELYSLYLQI